MVGPFLDQQWHDKLLPILQQTGEVYAALELPASELKFRRTAYEDSHYSQNPDLFPIDINQQAVQSVIDQILILKNDIEAHETNQDVRTAYSDRLQELADQNTIKLAAAARNEQLFDQSNERIYGSIESDIFKAECNWIHADLSSLDFPESQELAGLLPAFDNTLPLVPDIATFTKIKQLHEKHYYHQFFPTGMPSTEIIDAPTGRRIAQDMIDAIAADFVLVDSPNGLWAVMDSKKVVTAPIEYSLDNHTFLALMCHEIGSHLLEITNAHKQPLQLLRTGLDRYEAGNEGRAYLREQIFFDTPQDYVNVRSWSDEGVPLPSFEYRVSLHLVISLACGLAGERWDFTRCYRLLVLLQGMWRFKHHLARNDDACHDFAWHVVTRALKGTAGNGGAYRKDIVYIEGNVRAWQIAAEDPAKILQGDMGKFDIANPKHDMILKNLNIL